MILVFGQGGQLAIELAAMAAADGIALTGLTRTDADITSGAAVERAIRFSRPALVVNAAAYNLVDQAETEREAAMAVNARAPGIIAAVCAEVGAPMIHISTDYVFDGEKSGPYNEGDPIAPLGVYGKSKAEGEDAVRRACPHHLIIRTAWLFGSHGSNFFKTVLRLAAERDAFHVVADQRGSPTSTKDLAGAILTAYAAIGRGNVRWGTYHFAGSGETTRHGFASRIVEAQMAFTGRRSKVNAVASADYPTAARRPRNSSLDSTKFGNTFDFRAADWRTSVDRTIDELFNSKIRA